MKQRQTPSERNSYILCIIYNYSIFYINVKMKICFVYRIVVIKRTTAAIETSDEDDENRNRTAII